MCANLMCTALVGGELGVAPPTVGGVIFVSTAKENIGRVVNAKGWALAKTSTCYYEQVVWYHCSDRPQRRGHW